MRRGESVLIAQNGKEDPVVLSIKAFIQQNVGPELKEKLLVAEEQLASGVNPVSLEEAAAKWRAKVDAIHGRDTLLIRKCYAFDMKMIRF